MALAYLALGSNLGDRAANIAAALERLHHPPEIERLAVSSLYETAPVDCPPGAPPFLNAAAAFRTTLPARALLERMLAIEATLGRDRARDPAANAPRTIDLDLLLYDALVIDERGLRLPHPRLHERRFVLAPLAEISPDARHPVLGRTVGQLLAELSACSEAAPRR